MGKLILVGGGHAHMITLANLEVFAEKGHRVTVIGPSAYHYYSGMGPGMLGTTYTPEEIRFSTKKVVEKKGGIFVGDHVTRIDPERKEVFLSSGIALEYDVLSCNAGSYVDKTLIREDRGDIYTVKPIEKLVEARDRLVELCSQHLKTVGIVGGGPSSAEIAGNIVQLAKARNCIVPEIVIFAGHEFMGRFPKGVRSRVRRSLENRGVEIREQCRVTAVETGKIFTEDGKERIADLIFLASGVRPSPLFADSGLPTGPDGGLLVNRFLQSAKYPNIFGGGDCIYFQKQPLDKVGVYAVRQNPVLYNNLLAQLEGKELHPFEPGGTYLLIFNLGEEEGVLRKSWLTFGGKAAFRIKDYIDRKFMTQFQAAEQ